jgi:hypothetical protein
MAENGWSNWFQGPEAAKAFSTYGPVIQIAGAVNSAIGAYYQAQNQQFQLESQASSMRFRQELFKLNQEQSEYAAEQTMAASQREAGRIYMRGGAVKGAARASMAARGIQAGVGSAAETIATTDLVTEIDALTINANAVRAAENLRTQSVNYGTQSVMAGVSANNYSASAGSINPFASAGTSLIGGATSIMSNWAQASRMSALERYIAKEQG